MDEANTVNEKIKVMGDNLRAEWQLTVGKDEQLQAAKEKIKTIAAKVVEAFQQTEVYNTVLFNCYFKGFELLRRYLVNHPTEADLENLDLEDVNKEMAADEASQSTAPEGDAPESAPPPPANDDVAADAWTCYLSFFFLFFLLVPGVFWAFLFLIPKQYFYSNLRTMFLAQCLWAFNFNVETMMVARCFWAFNYIRDYILTFLFLSLHDPYLLRPLSCLICVGTLYLVKFSIVTCTFKGVLTRQ